MGYKAKEALRLQEVKEARDGRERKKNEAEKQAQETTKELEALAKTREEAWRQRELRVNKKRDLWLAEVLKEADLIRRKEQLAGERKMEFIKDLHVQRQKVFTEQNEKSRRRAKEIEDTKPLAEEEKEPPPKEPAEGEDAEPAKDAE